MADEYADWADLAAHETEGEDYRFVISRTNYATSHIAIHGGAIESGSAEMAKEVAGRYGHQLYCFEAIKSSGNSVMHVTSTHFDEPQCLAEQASVTRTVSYHGMDGDTKTTGLGGLDRALAQRIATALENAGFTVDYNPGEDINGDDPLNIANRNFSGAGVQLEMSHGQREAFFPDGDMGRAAREDPTARTAEFYAYADAIASAVGEGPELNRVYSWDGTEWVDATPKVFRGTGHVFSEPQRLGLVPESHWWTTGSATLGSDADYATVTVLSVGDQLVWSRTPGTNDGFPVTPGKELTFTVEDSTDSEIQFNWLNSSGGFAGSSAKSSTGSLTVTVPSSVAAVRPVMTWTAVPSPTTRRIGKSYLSEGSWSYIPPQYFDGAEWRLHSPEPVEFPQYTCSTSGAAANAASLPLTLPKNVRTNDYVVSICATSGGADPVLAGPSGVIATLYDAPTAGLKFSVAVWPWEPSKGRGVRWGVAGSTSAAAVNLVYRGGDTTNAPLAPVDSYVEHLNYNSDNLTLGDEYTSLLVLMALSDDLTGVGWPNGVSEREQIFGSYGTPQVSLMTADTPSGDALLGSVVFDTTVDSLVSAVITIPGKSDGNPTWILGDDTNSNLGTTTYLG